MLTNYIEVLIHYDTKRHSQTNTDIVVKVISLSNGSQNTNYLENFFEFLRIVPLHMTLIFVSSKAAFDDDDEFTTVLPITKSVPTYNGCDLDADETYKIIAGLPF